MSLTLRVLAVAAASAMAAPGAAAQDVEARAAVTGRTLPAGYYERVRQQPDFFEIHRGWTARAAAQNAGPVRQASLVSGTLRAAVVMALFADSPEPAFPADVTAGILFGANPDGNLTQFYRDISGNRLNLTGNVFPWVRTGTTRAVAAGSSFGLGGDARMGEYLVQALSQLDGTTDFGRFDNDGRDNVPNSGDDDGFVDVAVFQFLENAASCGGSGVWPHRARIRGWTGTPFATNDLTPRGEPVRVDDYIVQSAVECDGATPQSIAIIAHELGHILGLPDFYDASGGLLPAQRRWVLGCFSLMAGGSWGCGDGSLFGNARQPAHMGPYEKAVLGWITEQDVGTGWNMRFTLDPVQTSGRALRIPLRGGEEYLQVEYRPRTGFDAGLAASGVLVYHVEPRRPLRPCATCPRLYPLMLVEADNDGALLRSAQEGGNRGAAGDVFTGTHTLTEATHPLLRRHDGVPSELSMRITVEGGRAHVVVSTLAPLAMDRLLSHLLGTTAQLSLPEVTALDAAGNRNGRFDLGDARAYLRGSAGT
jgi:M6 family metalloprotease-like protein